MQYDSHRSKDSAYSKMSDTPSSCSWTVGIHFYKFTRSKDLLEHTCDLGLCISFDKIIKIENSFVNSVKQRI